MGNGNGLRSRSVETLPAGGRAAEPAGSLQRLQRLAQALVLDPERLRVIKIINISFRIIIDVIF
jgi:hypothetical protein